MSPGLEPNLSCSKCQKAFIKESSWKRHFYYCRSKPLDTSASRKRSCGACIGAKSRCIRPADPALTGACARCSSRHIRCDFAGAAELQQRSLDQPPPQLSIFDDMAPSTGNTQTGIQSFGSSAEDTLSLSRQCTIQNNEDWDAGFFSAGLEAQGSSFLQDSDMNHLLNTLNQLEMDTILSSFASPYSLNITGPSLFDRRIYTMPSHTPLASLVMRILRSYPFMMLQKGAPPPFVHSLHIIAAEGGTGKAQQTLMTCSALVDLFKSRTGSERNTVWNLIRLEQERISIQYMDFDRWELLAAFQALLVYCLLRLHGSPIGHSGLEASVLTTVNLIFGALGVEDGIGPVKIRLIDGTGTTWSDWVHAESVRRTVLLFQILNTLVQISSEPFAYPNCGLAIMPLPSRAALWNTQVAEDWQLEFDKRCQERSLYALSRAGLLTKIHVTQDGMTSNTEEWEEWRAEIGDIGTLVMMVGALL